MKLADRRGLYTRSLQAVPPAIHAPVISKAIVPIASLMRVLAGCEICAGRDTDGRVRVGTFKPRPMMRQPVEVWCFRNGMAITAERISAVLIIHDDQQIGGIH